MRVFARAVIIVLVLATVLSIGAFLIQMPAYDHSLRFGAQAPGLLLGAAVAARPLKNDVIYAQTLAREFNILVPENAMKFSALHPRGPGFDFANADAIVDFAIFPRNPLGIMGPVDMIANALLSRGIPRRKLVAQRRAAYNAPQNYCGRSVH